MSANRNESSEALYRLVNNPDRPDWIRRDALQGLIDREEVYLLESIVNNSDRPDWIRKMALKGLRKI